MFFMLAALSLNDLLSVLWLECTRQSRSLKPQPHAAAVLFWCTAVAGGEGGEHGLRHLHGARRLDGLGG